MNTESLELPFSNKSVDEERAKQLVREPQVLIRGSRKEFT